MQAGSNLWKPAFFRRVPVQSEHNGGLEKPAPPLVFNSAWRYAQGMIRFTKHGTLLLLILLAGCMAYEPANVTEGVISNPKVGWNGYSIRIPDGVALIQNVPDEPDSERSTKIKEWYADASSRYAAEYYTSFYEQFLLENPEQTFFLSFISETYELATGWAVMNSVDKQYIIQKMINRKMVVINDMKAHSEQIEMSGQRGWYVSGLAKPYFKKDAVPLAYEGIFLLGTLKEAFWIEAFGAPQIRDEMKKQVFEMAESLDVK